MTVTRMSYKGKEVLIDQQDDKATVTVDNQTFACSLHRGTFDVWHCDRAYFASPDLKELARHFVDYLYVFTDPNTAPPEPAAPPHEHGHGGHHH